MQKSWNFAALCVILIVKVFESEAGCVWNFGNPGTECLMQCITSNTTSVIKEIEEKWSEVMKSVFVNVDEYI